MDKKGAVTNFNYILLIASIPGIFFILTIISYIVYKKAATIFLFLSIGSLFLIVIGFFITAIFFGKVVNDTRRKSWNPMGEQNFFFDIVNESNRLKWKVKEDGKRKIAVNGALNNQSFELIAELNKGIKSTSEDIAINFLIPKRDNFYLTQGNLPGILGEKIIKEVSFNRVTAIGKSTQKVVEFLNNNKTTIEELFRNDYCISELHFEDGQMDAVILSDYDKSGQTKIVEIIDKLAVLVKSYKEIFD